MPDKPIDTAEEVIGRPVLDVAGHEVVGPEVKATFAVHLVRQGEGALVLGENRVADERVFDESPSPLVGTGDKVVGWTPVDYPRPSLKEGCSGLFLALRVELVDAGWRCSVDGCGGVEARCREMSRAKAEGFEIGGLWRRG